ncbi:lysoplasmalogenase [Paenibacillus assamensis]|uniref:lysoplasmalogenase n=1 Tax=Paenibacillus assamensis TaxID=311244 RepID=UPI0003F681E6|nr:lysoplasmalogenase [Paenibacillus assamensis]
MNNLIWIIVGIAQLCTIGTAAFRASQDVSGQRKFPKMLCMLFSSLLVVTSWLVAVSADFATPYVWLAAGMSLSFIGDLSMAALLPWRHPIIGGMITFGLGHLCYMISFTQIANSNGFTIYNEAFITSAIVLIVTQLYVWRRILNVPTQPRAIVNGAAVYGLLVGFTAVYAAGLWQAVGGLWLLPLVGGLLFVWSDFLIGWFDIGGRKLRNPRLWIWITYGFAQICIVYAPLVHLLQ